MKPRTVNDMEAMQKYRQKSAAGGQTPVALDLRGAKSVARELGICLRTLYNWVKSPYPPPTYKVGGTVWASSAELYLYMRERPHMHNHAHDCTKRATT